MSDVKKTRSSTAVPGLYRRAIADAIFKLDPRTLIHNPVMFTVEVGSAITTLLYLQALAGAGEAPAGFIGAISAWLWFTVLFANFAEALAEGRGKAQADSLRKMRQDTTAKRLRDRYRIANGSEPQDTDFEHGLLIGPAQVRPVLCKGGGHDPGGRRDPRRHRIGERERDHRGKRPGHPRIRRGPECSHRAERSSFPTG